MLRKRHPALKICELWTFLQRCQFPTCQKFAWHSRWRQTELYTACGAYLWLYLAVFGARSLLILDEKWSYRNRMVLHDPFACMERLTVVNLHDNWSACVLYPSVPAIKSITASLIYAPTRPRFMVVHSCQTCSSSGREFNSDGQPACLLSEI